MTITVLIAVYKSDKPKYLDRALQSVWDDQVMKPSEIVLVKDGPLDSELDNVISAWQTKLDHCMTVLSNEVNLGLTKSLIKGLHNVKGELIARMDSDDVSHPDRFLLQHEFLMKHEEISVVGGSIMEFNHEDSCLRIRKYPQTPNDVKKYIVKASPLAHPAVMMRRRVFDDGITYDDSYRTSQDIALWFDLLAAGYLIGNIDTVVLYFRLDNDLYKRRNRQKAINEFKIYMNGIYRLYGIFTFSYIYPILRLVFRMLPERLIRCIYGSRLRKRVLNF